MTLKVEDGKSYLCRNGMTVIVKKRTDPMGDKNQCPFNILHPVSREFIQTITEEGFCIAQGTHSGWDLISEVNDHIPEADWNNPQSTPVEDLERLAKAMKEVKVLSSNKCSFAPPMSPDPTIFGPASVPPLSDLSQFSTGAVRSIDANSTRYDLISPIGLRRIAETYKEGYDKYGAFNWEKGMPISDIMNHCIRHIYKFLEGDRTEDHLAHAAWNLIAAMHMQETHPELNHQLREPINENGNA